MLCYETSVEGAGEECSPTHQLETAYFYSDCCVVEGVTTASTHRYIMEQEQCALCGMCIRHSFG